MIPLTYLTLIKIYLLVWFWVSFEPLQDFIDNLWDKIPTKITKYKLVDYIYVALGCSRCLCLYVTLVLTGNIFMAILLSMVADIQKKLIK